MSAWTELTKSEYDDVWDRFYADFQFRPSILPADWPGIREPEPSETYRIGHIYGNPEAERLIGNLDRSALAAYRSCVGNDESIYALDWQHPCYWFKPHQQKEADPWKVPSLPNGDYYIFLAVDFRFGWFGHPWEQTICVFGQQLLTAIHERPPEVFSGGMLRARK
jgi:hypothetical protein